MRDHRTGDAGRSARALESRRPPVQRRDRSRRAEAGREALPQVRAAGGPYRRQQPADQPRLPDDHRQRPAAAQAEGHGRGPRPLRAQLDPGHRRAAGSGVARRTRAQRRGFRPDARPLGRAVGPLPGAAAARAVHASGRAGLRRRHADRPAIAARPRDRGTRGARGAVGRGPACRAAVVRRFDQPRLRPVCVRARRLAAAPRIQGPGRKRARRGADAGR